MTPYLLNEALLAKTHNLNTLLATLMLLVPTTIRCCAHIVRLVCGQMDGRRRTDGQTNPRWHARRGLKIIS